MPHKDLRRARAAAINIVPTSTGCRQGHLGLVLPAAEGQARRLTRCGCRSRPARCTDLVVTLGREVTVQEVNAAYQAAAGRRAERDTCDYTEDPIVSTDIVGQPGLLHLRQQA